MEIKTIVTVMIAGMLGAVVFVGLLPVFAETSSADTTFTNKGYFRMAHYGTDEEITISWDITDPNTIVVNTDTVKVEHVTGSANITILADTYHLLRMNLTDGTATGISYVSSGGGTKTATSTLTATYSGGSGSIVIDGTTNTASYSDLYVPSSTGPYVMKINTEDAYINEDSEVFAYGLTKIKKADGTTITSPGAGFQFSGSIEDGITGLVWRNSDTTTVSDEAINYTEVDSYKDLYKFKDITATATLTQTIEGETVLSDTELTYNYLLVPYQVTAEKSIHADPPTTALLNLLPVLIAIGLIIGVAGAIFIKRM